MTGGRVAARPGSGRRTRARGRAGGSGTPLDAAAPPGLLGPGSPRSQAEQRRCPRPEPSRSQTDAPGQRGGRVEPPLVSCRSRSSLRVLQGVAGARLPTHCDTLSHGGTVPGPRAPRALPTKAPRGLRLLLLSLPLIWEESPGRLAICSDLNGSPERHGEGAGPPAPPREGDGDQIPVPRRRLREALGDAPGAAPKAPGGQRGARASASPCPPRDGPGVNVSFLTG